MNLAVGKNILDESSGKALVLFLEACVESEISSSSYLQSLSDAAIIAVINAMMRVCFSEVETNSRVMSHISTACFASLDSRLNAHYLSENASPLSGIECDAQLINWAIKLGLKIEKLPGLQGFIEQSSIEIAEKEKTSFLFARIVCDALQKGIFRLVI